MSLCPSSLDRVRITLVILLVAGTAFFKFETISLTFDTSRGKSLLSQETHMNDDDETPTRSRSEPSPASIEPARSSSIVCQLSGELGNNLAKLSTAYGLHLWLKQEFDWNSTILIRHQENTIKWKGVASSLKQCFPSTRSFNFSQCNTAEFLLKQNEQAKWLGKNAFAGINGAAEAKVRSALAQFVEQSRARQRHGNQSSTLDEGQISMPFLYANSMLRRGLFLNRFYNEIRQFLAFDPSCCKLLPEPDESVFVSASAAARDVAVS